MDLRKVKSLFPQGANNYDRFCETVHSRTLDLVPEDEVLYGVHNFSYIDGNGIETQATCRRKMVMYDHLDKTYYDEELNPYKKETLPHFNSDEYRCYEIGDLKEYPILELQRRRITQRSYANVELLSKENAKYWLYEFNNEYIWRRGNDASRNVWVVTEDEQHHQDCLIYLIPRAFFANMDYYLYGDIYYYKSLCDKVIKVRNGNRYSNEVPRRIYNPETESFSDYDFSGYTKCHHCNKWYLSDYIEDNGNCRWCNHPEVRIYSYHGWDGEYVKQSMPGEDAKVFIGAEIEQVNKNDRSDLSSKDLVADYLDVYHLEHDGSLNGGFEMISQPLSWECWKANYERNKALFQALADAGMVSDEDPDKKCGGHKHISKNAFNGQKAIDRAKAIINGLYWEMQKFGRRQDTGYSSFKSIGKYPTAETLCSVDTDHYSAFSVSSHTAKTIEIRFFKGTLNIDTFYAELEFCKNLVEVANDFSKEVVYFEDLIYGDFVPQYWEGRKAKMSTTYIPRKNAVDLRFYDHGQELELFFDRKDCLDSIKYALNSATEFNNRAGLLGLNDLNINVGDITNIDISLDEFAEHLAQTQLQEGGAN